MNKRDSNIRRDLLIKLNDVKKWKIGMAKANWHIDIYHNEIEEAIDEIINYVGDDADMVVNYGLWDRMIHDLDTHVTYISGKDNKDDSQSERILDELNNFIESELI